MTPTDPKPTPALLACPCGKPAEDGYHEAYSTDSSYHYIGCTECGLRIPYDENSRHQESHASRIAVLKRWNAIPRPSLPVEGDPEAGDGDTPEVDTVSEKWKGNPLDSNHLGDLYKVAWSLERRLSALLNGKGEGDIKRYEVKPHPDGLRCVRVEEHPQGMFVTHHDHIRIVRRLSEENKGEPVAGWLISDAEGNDDFCNNPSALDQFHYRGGAPRPLYTAPVPMPRLWDADTIKDAPEGVYRMFVKTWWDSDFTVADARVQLKIGAMKFAFGPIPQPPAAPVKGA